MVFRNQGCIHIAPGYLRQVLDDLMEIGNESWLSKATKGDSLGKHPGFYKELSIDHILDEAADSDIYGPAPTLGTHHRKTPAC